MYCPIPNNCWSSLLAAAGSPAVSASHHEGLASYPACTDWQAVFPKLYGLVVYTAVVFAVGAAAEVATGDLSVAALYSTTLATTVAFSSKKDSTLPMHHD